MTNQPFRLGIVTEIHIVPPGTRPLSWHNPFLSNQAEQLFRKALNRCVEEQVDAIAILGDLTHFADARSFAVIRRIVEKIDIPIFVLPGNHDLDESERPLAAFHGALELPHVHLAPENLALTPEIDLVLVGLQPGDGPWRYAAIRSHAATGNDAHLTLVLTHFPLCAMETMLADQELKHAGDLDNRQEMLDDIGQIDGPVLIVNGHLHVHATIADGRRLQLSVAALTEPPHDVSVLTIGFDDVGAPRITRDATALIETPDAELPVLSDRTEHWQFVDNIWSMTTS